MRRILPVVSVVAMVATLLTATPAAADELGRAQQPILRAPTDVDAADAVVAPVSDDAHPVTPDVELVTFGTEPAAGTPEAIEAEAEAGTADTDPDTTQPTDDASESTEPADPTEPVEEPSQATEPTPDESAESTEATDPSTATEQLQGLSSASTMSSMSVTDEASEEATSLDAATDTPSDPPATEEPSDDTSEEPSDAPATEEPSGEATEEASEEPSIEADVEDEGHDHGEEGHEHDASGEELTEQLYASAETPELSVLGVTWDLGSAADDLVVEVRTQSDEVWGEWEPLHVEATETRDDEAEVDGARDGTLPLALIDVQKVEVRLASDTSLPTAPSLAVVDPGESTADAAPVTTSAMTTMSTNRPTIYSRAQWGADESMMTWSPSQGRVQGIDIHHTVNANDYTASQVPALMRSIYAYHAQDWGRGWGDIGYNFVVDRFGRIWEGRYGGVDQAPVGAHATGLNSNFSGISLLGNFDITPVPSAAFTSVARLAAWKLAMHGNTSPYGTVTVDAGTFNRINGHRDSKQTTCPGRYMYNRLGEMRSRINSYIGSFAGRELDRDLDGDGYADLVMRTGSDVSLISSVDQGVLSYTDRGDHWSPTRSTIAGDLTGDGNPDLLMVRPDGRLYLYPGTSSGSFPSSERRVLYTGWGRVTGLAGGVDWNGDGIPDLFQRRSDGTLWLYHGMASGRFSKGTRVASGGWDGMTSFSLVPRWVGDSPALLAQSERSGRLYAYRPSSSGALAPPNSLGDDRWSGARFIAGSPSAVGSSAGDVVMLTRSGELWLFPGTGRGEVSDARRVPLGSTPTDTRLVLAYERADELLGFFTIRANQDHSLRRYVFRTTHEAYSTPKPTGLRIASGDRLVVAVGDWDDDGWGDLAVLKGDGRFMLHLGTGNGRFRQDGTVLITGWNTYRYGIVGAGDIRGDGSAGVIAWDRSAGRLWYYASDGARGIEPKVRVSNGADGMDMLVNAGFWDGPGAPDFILRGADSARLFHYDGNGPGLALPPTTGSGGWGWMDSIVGAADVTWDGRPDLITVNTAGLVRVYAGNGRGGLALWATMASVPDAAVIS